MVYGAVAYILLPRKVPVVNRAELEELHYITPLENVPSIMQTGILSYSRARKMDHQSVAMQQIQRIREGLTIPGGRKLHEYANLYICARNPMMYKRRSRHAELCVLRISTDVLDIPNVVVSDSNAASRYVRFVPAPDGLRIVNRELTFANDWTDPDPIQKFRKAAAKCAEVLVPDQIRPEYITCAYVSCQESLDKFNDFGLNIQAEINGNIFFQ